MIFIVNLIVSTMCIYIAINVKKCKKEDTALYFLFIRVKPR